MSTSTPWTELSPASRPCVPNTSKFTASDPKGEGRALRMGEGAMHARALSVGPGRIHERRARRDGAPQRHRSRLRRSQERAEVERRRARIGSFPAHRSRTAWLPASALPLDELRKDFTTDGFKVMGEIGLQYEGLSPSDPSVDAYFALAEELDIPVAIHMGTGGSGRANIAMPKFRGSMGNPLAARRTAGAPPQAARAGDARRLSHDRQHAHAAAGELPRLRRRRRTDLELSHQRSQSLHRAPRRRRIRRPRDVRNRPTRSGRS